MPSAKIDKKNLSNLLSQGFNPCEFLASFWRVFGEFFRFFGVFVAMMRRNWYSYKQRKDRWYCLASKKRVQISLTDNQIDILGKLAKEKGFTKSAIVALALEEYSRKELEQKK